MRRKVRQMPVFFWRGRKNFGDLLTPLLLRHFCGIEATWAPVQEAALVGVGSIIELVPDGWDGTIIGTGKLHAETKLPVGRGRILALRGPLTAAGVRGDFALGDLGLLANELVRTETKRHDIGIVPHWSDETLIDRTKAVRKDALAIFPDDEPLEVIRQIGECRKIVCSSLHGMILADAFGIPRRVEVAPHMEYEGGHFKFRDYSLAIQTKFEAGKLTQANRKAVDNLKSELYDALRSLV